MKRGSALDPAQECLGAERHSAVTEQDGQVAR
jgi:hypothetical protein